jgi:hypothetical protein
MATSVTHAGQYRGTGTLVTWLVVTLLGCAGPPGPPPGPKARSLGAPPGSLSLVATGDSAQLRAYLGSLDFDVVAAAGDEQRLLVRGPLPGTACHGDSTHSCSYGPLAKIEPVIGAHERDTTELNQGQVIARLFLRPGETEPYPKLGLAPEDTTYWWVQRQTDTTALSQYLRLKTDSLVATALDTIAIELHPPGTFQQALARFIWDDADEKTQGPCGQGCCK